MSDKSNHIISELNKINKENLLLEISNSLLGTLDYEEVLQIISNGMSELLGIESSAIYLMQNENEIYLGAATPPLDPFLSKEIRKAHLDDHPHIYRAFKEKKAQLIEDTFSEELSPAEQFIVDQIKLRSIIYLPFIQKNTVLGVLILSTTDEQRQFTVDEINLAQIIANQLSIGIKNAQLHYDIQLKNKSLEEQILEKTKAQQELLVAHSKLEESEKKYRNLFDQAAEGIVLMDLDGNILQMNDAFAVMHGYDNIGQISEKNIKQFDVLKDGVFSERKEDIERLMNGNIIQLEVEHIHRNGHHFPLHVISQLIKIGNDDLLLCFHQDLTEQKKIANELKMHRDHLEILVRDKTAELDATIEELTSVNEELFDKNNIIKEQNAELKQTLLNLQEAQSRLIQSEKMASLGILTAGVAHELNNPLNYINGAYYALERYFKDNCNESEFSKNILKSIYTGLERSVAIVSSLSQFSRENSKLDENCNIHDIIDNCLTMLNSKMKYSIDLQKQYTNANVTITGNTGQLHQVFLNILTNAIHAVEPEGIIEIITSRQDSGISICVTDNGIGIKKDIISKITDPFFTTKDPGKGTGLGLSIAYSIIKEHKGSISFDSDEGRGTKVTIVLPV